VAGPRGEWLLSHLEDGFTLIVFGAAAPADVVAMLARDPTPCAVLQVGGMPVAGAIRVDDSEGLVSARYDGNPGTCYLFRPDQHVCARWRDFDLRSVRESIARAIQQACTEAREAA
jgi:3-(3-hydroxy-phenyl)propionate hydroxylase